MSFKIKILIIIPSLEIGGGAEKNAYNLGQNLFKKYDVRYLKFYNFKDEYDVAQKCYCLQEKPKKNNLEKLFYIYKRIKFIKKTCQKYESHLVISFGFYSNILVSISSLKRNYKVILSVRSNIYKQSFIIRNISRMLYNKMDSTHVVTKKMSSSLKSIGINNIEHIYNGHQLQNYQTMANEDLPISIPIEKYVYLNIGRLNKAKGQWHLLKAFSLCSRENPNLILIIIGEGELEKELKHLVNSLNLQDKVIMLKNTLNIFPYIKRANCFCFTSLYEGLPNVLIETLSVNTPIITSDCVSGPREIAFPELNIDENIKYPYESNGCILTAPFISSNIDITTKVNTLEENYSLAMDSIRAGKDNNYDYSSKVDIFAEKIIYEKWDNLIERLYTN